MNTRDSIQRAYDKAAQQYAANFWNEFDQKHFDRELMLDWFARQFGPDDRVLEIGAGPGEVSGYLSSRGVRVTGTDLSPEMVEQARRYFPGLQFEVMDFFDLRYPDDAFGGVVGYYAIVNLTMEEIAQVFCQVRRVLCAGGLFLFTFHAFEHEDRTDVQNFLVQDGEALTFYYFDVDEMKALVERLGFRVVDILVRYPYPGVEYQSKRSYFIVRKLPIGG